VTHAVVAPVPGSTASPLDGYTIGVTAARRSAELSHLLERRGADVVCAPAIRIVPLTDDGDLLRATEQCITQPPDLTVVTTGIGFRGWMEAADGWGLGDALRTQLGRGRLVARGPKARGAIRTSGLREEWSPDSEAMPEVVDYLLKSGVDGFRIAVQLHGEPLTETIERLTAAGAEVVPVPVYRWTPPDDPRPLERLVDLVATSRIDALVFTSAPAVTSLLRTAVERELESAVLHALHTDVLAACVGPVCAGPLDRLGVPSVHPARGRLGNLVRTICDELPMRSRVVVANGHRLQLRGQGVIVDSSYVEIPPVPLAVLRALAASPGRVVSRPELLAALPNGGNAHVVEMAVGRLRRHLGDPELVRTVVQRGYQLAADT
jgi:uroporphyrinogen-III synthase